MLPFLWQPAADDSETCADVLPSTSQTGRPASVYLYVGTIHGINMFISVKQI